MAFQVPEYLAKKYPKERGDYGIRVARPGFDAEKCAENQLLFNSAWPILQIAGIIDLDDLIADNTHYPVANYYISSYPTLRISKTMPAGYTKVSPGQYMSTYNVSGDPKVWVSSKYLMYMLGSESGRDSNGVYWNKVYYKKKSHGLNFTPMFLSSSRLGQKQADISAKEHRKVVLFNIDLMGNNVDYSYPDVPLPFLQGTSDYGLKSTSIIPNMDGLSTGYFSKLVQAVRVKKPPFDTVDDSLAWSPLTEKSSSADAKGCLLPFECYAYVGMNMPSDQEEFISTEKLDDSAPYFRNEFVQHIVDSQYASGTVDDAYAYNINMQYLKKTDVQSMVVLRSPMVAPDREEVIVS